MPGRPMRPREKILANLEEVYREAFERAKKEEDSGEMASLDFRFQRDQLFLEAVLDVRSLLKEHNEKENKEPREPDPEEESLLEKAQKLRRITRLR